MIAFDMSLIFDKAKWPFFYGGLGFALASILISVVYIAYSFRNAAVRGLISKVVSEAILVLLFVPSASAVFALLTAYKFARDAGHDDAYSMFLLFGFGTISIAVYFYNKVGPNSGSPKD